MNSENPLISVVVQTYQQVNFIKQCLDGILMQQTNFPFEIILGEDESNDGTREICIEYANKYPDKINLFLRSRTDVIYINGNPTGRFNFIQNLKAAKGKYIAICEGDDYWVDENHLKNKIEFLEKNDDFILCYSGINVINDKSIIIKSHDFGNHKSIYEHSDLPIFAHTSTRVFRNINLNYLSRYLEAPGIDTILTNYLSQFGKIKFFNKATSNYRIHDGGIFSSLNTKDQLLNQISTSLNSLDFIDKKLFLKFYSIIFNFYYDLSKESNIRDFYINLNKFYKVNKDYKAVFSNKNKLKIECTFMFLLFSNIIFIERVRDSLFKKLNWKITF